MCVCVCVCVLRFGRNAKIVHFIGAVKPWQHRYLPEVDSVVLLPGTYTSQHAALDYIRRWWRVFNSLEQVREMGEWRKRGEGSGEWREKVRGGEWVGKLMSSVEGNKGSILGQSVGMSRHI